MAAALQAVTEMRAMAADQAGGMTQKAIGAKYGIHPNTVRARLRRYRAHLDARGPEQPVLMLEIDPAAELIDLITTREWITKQLEELACDQRHPGYRVAALTRLDEIKERRLRLLQACGLVPRRLSWWYEDQAQAAQANELARLLEKHEVPDEVLREFQRYAEEKRARAAGGGVRIVTDQTLAA